MVKILNFIKVVLKSAKSFLLEEIKLIFKLALKKLLETIRATIALAILTIVFSLMKPMIADYFPMKELQPNLTQSIQPK